MINGIIIIDKEPGFTSHDVVAKLRGICGQKKIGHTGTLDPAATGVLPVCLGNATKLCDMLTDHDKVYEAELMLGCETDTEDMTGEILKESPVNVTEEQVREVCLGFIGEYDQVPPMYSALKVNGKKLYELAREGKVIEREARRVTIANLEILEITLPVVRMRVSCSKGTYIRTLCADIGRELGCGGAMKSLRRTQVGTFTLKDAFTLCEIQKMKDEGRLEETVRPSDSVFMDCPALHVKESAFKAVDNGNALTALMLEEEKEYPPETWVRIYRGRERFIGVYAFDTEKNWYKPVKMFF